MPTSSKTTSSTRRQRATAPPAIDLAALAERFDKLIAEKSFASYTELSTWLAGHGYSITRTTRAADRRSRFERRLDEIRLVTKQARAVVGAFGDGDKELNEALLRLVQQRLFEILRAAGRNDMKRLNLGALARAVAEMSRASVLQERWLLEMRVKLRQRVASAEAQVGELSREAGLSPETEARIRNALLDITV
jgi:ABC-type transporter Mla subunit MlaD